MVKLVPIDKMPSVSGVDVPKQFYFLLLEPVLAGMQQPNGTCWQSLYEAGLRGVVCLAGETPTYDPRPLSVVHTTDLEDLVDGEDPKNPREEVQKIQKAVSCVLKELDAGRGVVVHCVGGRGRTGTVLGCVLRERGLPGDEVVQHLDELHKARGRPGWPESPWQDQLVQDWLNHPGRGD